MKKKKNENTLKLKNIIEAIPYIKMNLKEDQRDTEKTKEEKKLIKFYGRINDEL